MTSGFSCSIAVGELRIVAGIVSSLCSMMVQTDQGALLCVIVPHTSHLLGSVLCKPLFT